MFDLIVRIINDRVTQTVALGAFFVLLGGLYRPPELIERSGEDPRHLFLNKAHNAKDYDVVLGGDSRMYSCLSPAEMSAVLGDIRIINFGFELTGFDDMYLDRIREVVNANSEYATIVLGVTPQSLTPASGQETGFKSSIRKTGWPLMRDMYMPRFLRFFDPYEFRYLIRYLRGESPSRHLWRYNADGFVDVDMVPLVAVDKVEGVKRTFEGNQVAEERVRQLMDYVTRWSGEGIQVYGFRPPTSTAIATMEDEFSGYNETEIRKRFEAAGGVWLEVQHGKYGSYDGHHLLGYAARVFSTDFANQMTERGWKKR